LGPKSGTKWPRFFRAPASFLAVTGCPANQLHLGLPEKPWHRAHGVYGVCASGPVHTFGAGCPSRAMRSSQGLGGLAVTVSVALGRYRTSTSFGGVRQRGQPEKLDFYIYIMRRFAESVYRFTR